VEPVPTRATSGEPSHPDATLTPTRDENPDGGPHDHGRERSGLGAALQDVQDALGHADPRTTRRYDRSRHNLDRSPNYLLATALTAEGA
jgi:integrase